jgi:hypothetical protein
MSANQKRSLIDMIPLEDRQVPVVEQAPRTGLVARALGAGPANAVAARPGRSLIDAAFDEQPTGQEQLAIGAGLRDLAGRAGASALGAPVDLASMAMAPLGYSHPAPIGGSEWIGQRLVDGGIVSEQRRPVAELLTGLAAPAAALPKGLAFAAAMSPEGKARLLADLVAGKGSGTYRLGDVTEGQHKGLGKLFGQDGAARDVYMTDDATQHLLKGRINENGFLPAEVANFAENAMARGAKPDLNIAKQNQNPSLLGLPKRDAVTGRQYESRIPLEQIDNGYVVRTVVPEGLPARNKKPPQE